MPSLKGRVNQWRKVMAGKVYLVGAGPGDPELLTLKALRVLKTADVVLHDELVGPEILSFVSPAAQVQNVGKRCGRKSATQAEINALLVNYGLLDLQVVRLKGGDPLIFGRGGEEIEALRKANLDVEVIPGVTAALGAAAATQIPLTHRRFSSSLIFITNHHSSSANTRDWPGSISPTATVVVYMPGYAYAATARQLVAAGLRASTPCAIISQATRSEEKVYITTIEELRSAPRLAAPTLLVVGAVVRLAAHPSLHDQASARSEELFSLVAQSEFFTQSQGITEVSERPE
jgi:uroporphyrin-III C-methyltransferase